MVPAERIQKLSNIIYYLIVCSSFTVGSLATCVTRRCLASKLIAMQLFSPPMPPECTITVNLTSIQYETLSVNTKSLHFSSRIRVDMEWNDPDLAWTDTAYNFPEIMMPVDTIWTPDLTVDNAISTNVKPVSTDILVKQDGTVQHAIQLYITVVCGINLFTYPFVRDGCPVALNGWSENTCGLRILYGSVSSVGTNRGEWITLSVELNQDKERLDRNYLYVTMSTNPFNTIVTLLLPSALIMLADLGSFALPLEGGNRSSFKITLVLSFTMSLLILTENLPDTGLCSPLIRYHFCFCLIILVLSLLLSMVLSRFSDSGAILPRKRQKPCESSYINRKDGINKDMTLNGMSTISDEVTAKDASIQKIVTFVENIEKTNEKTKKRHEYASRFDRACFWAYLFLDIVYVICVIGITRTEFCKINNFDFWM
ncbi:5-hydroxytryptamine receptor 3A-like [Silurus meridionalis]|uniref:5-hydroxytryptamine receptor 3A-like n=1 Tax=Silurus meridionalis TaxID=175797 RepID=UPI001EEB55E0|nr:5-hydroxytryptamine receptor 3A-like [Silurus meridionalis]